MYKYKIKEFNQIHQLKYFRYLCLAFYDLKDSNPLDFNQTQFGTIKKIDPLIQKKKWVKLFIKITEKNKNILFEKELEVIYQK